ncbi:hypothetical protein M408DRAFT_16712 [Serendipita vermifera MAFF 305830]|uniref:Uncharacterized protein n=1 Tax=Serendipita vermifera MAFF 305830 TaxID=933852 RepID=A0A0C3AR63_SERVB|nr:hypothetical protein M408DRAFT_16712 [Serendipita vermifera MAFF 305830]
MAIVIAIVECRIRACGYAQTESIVNIIAFFLLLGSNIYIVAGPGHIYHNLKETYLSPAYWVFFIWFLIHLLLLGYLIYQFTGSGKEVIIRGIRWRFPLIAVLSAIYIHVRAREYYIVAFIFALFVNSNASHIYYVVKKFNKRGSLSDELFVHIPFSIYYGWSNLLIFLAGFEAFGNNADTQPAGAWTKLFVFLSLFILETTAAAFVFASPESDPAGAITITWSLFGIYAHQSAHGSSGFVSISALVFAVLSVVWVVWSAWNSYKSRDIRDVPSDEERAPLVVHD